MKRFIEGIDREQGLLFPDYLDDFVGEDNPGRCHGNRVTGRS